MQYRIRHITQPVNNAGNKFLEVTTLKKFIFLSLSVVLLLVLITGCVAVQAPPVTVNPPVIGSFTSTNNPSGTSTLSWSVNGANTVSIDNGIGQVDMSGSKEISPISYTVYTMSATNSAGTVTSSAVTTVNNVPLQLPAVTPVLFAVTKIEVSPEPITFKGACPKTFTYTATFTANGPGTATYRWEREDLRYSGIQSITFTAAGTQTAVMQWEMNETFSGWIRAHVITPSDITSIPVNFTLTCSGN
jgi:hypothetical protein